MCINMTPTKSIVVFFVLLFFMMPVIASTAKLSDESHLESKRDDRHEELQNQRNELHEAFSRLDARDFNQQQERNVHFYQTMKRMNHSMKRMNHPMKRMNHVHSKEKRSLDPNIFMDEQSLKMPDGGISNTKLYKRTWENKKKLSNRESPPMTNDIVQSTLKAPSNFSNNSFESTTLTASQEHTPTALKEHSSTEDTLSIDIIQRKVLHENRIHVSNLKFVKTSFVNSDSAEQSDKSGVSLLIIPDELLDEKPVESNNSLIITDSSRNSNSTLFPLPFPLLRNYTSVTDDSSSFSTLTSPRTNQTAEVASSSPGNVTVATLLNANHSTITELPAFMNNSFFGSSTLAMLQEKEIMVQSLTKEKSKEVIGMKREASEMPESSNVIKRSKESETVDRDLLLNQKSDENEKPEDYRGAYQSIRDFITPRPPPEMESGLNPIKFLAEPFKYDLENSPEFAVNIMETNNSEKNNDEREPNKKREPAELMNRVPKSENLPPREFPDAKRTIEAVDTNDISAKFYGSSEINSKLQKTSLPKRKFKLPKNFENSYIDRATKISANFANSYSQPEVINDDMQRQNGFEFGGITSSYMEGKELQFENDDQNGDSPQPAYSSSDDVRGDFVFPDPLAPIPETNEFSDDSGVFIGDMDTTVLMRETPDRVMKTATVRESVAMKSKVPPATGSEEDNTETAQKNSKSDYVPIPVRANKYLRPLSKPLNRITRPFENYDGNEQLSEATNDKRGVNYAVSHKHKGAKTRSPKKVGMSQYGSDSVQNDVDSPQQATEFFKHLGEKKSIPSFGAVLEKTEEEFNLYQGNKIPEDGRLLPVIRKRFGKSTSNKNRLRKKSSKNQMKKQTRAVNMTDDSTIMRLPYAIASLNATMLKEMKISLAKKKRAFSGVHPLAVDV